MELSIVIPAYNEAERLPETLRHIAQHLATIDRTTEIIVVDDGSSDSTAAAATESPVPVRLVRHPRNLGKGAAVRTGMAAAEGEWRYLCDADLSTPIDELEHFWRRRHEAELVIGSRRVSGATIGRHQAWWKETLGALGNTLIQVLAAPGIKDTQCGFKLFHRRTDILFRRQQLDRWGYDFEILYLARLAGFRILEIPVRWTNDARSRVRAGDYLTTLLDLVRIHYFKLRGFYRFP